MAPTAPAPERHARYRWAATLADGARALDAGCGTGWGTAVLAERAAMAVGVDFSPPALAEARRAHGERATFIEGDLLDLPCEQDAFDLAVCFEALPHVAEPERAIEELRRVLRPGGLLLLSSPNPAVYPPGNPLHLSQTSPQELARLLRAAFANVALHGQQSYFASMIGSDELLASADAETGKAVEVTKLSCGADGPLHVLGVASDGSLPQPPAQLTLGEDVDYRELETQLAEWQERAVQAEAEVCALHRKLSELRRAQS